MNISKILLSTTLIIISCNTYNVNAQASINIIQSADTEEKTMYYNMLTSSYENLKDYKINNIVEIDNPDDPENKIPNPLYGAIYDEKDDGKYYLVDENGNKFFDLQTRINTITGNDQYLTNLDTNSSALNLIVKSFNDNTTHTYTLTSPSTDLGEDGYLKINVLYTNTNLIIPKNTTLDSKDVNLIFNTKEPFGPESIGNSNILIFGNITNKQPQFISSFLFFNKLVKNVIIGPEATYYYNCENNKYSPIEFSNIRLKCVLYPGCKIQMSDIIEDNLEKVISNGSGNHYCTINQFGGNLLLNRYVIQQDTDKLVGTIHQNSHIIYPTAMEDSNEEDHIKDGYKLTIVSVSDENNMSHKFAKTQYFSSLHWTGDPHNYNTEPRESATYHFEEPIPIVFDDETKVLKLNPNNELAKYDVKLWNQCKVDSGKYSFNEFCNIQSKYIDTNTIEDLFMDGKTYNNTGLLRNMPNEILVGIIGEKDIEIKESDSKNILLLGDNSGYNGTMTIPDNITDIYLKTISKINNIRYKNETYANDEKIPGVMFHYIDQNSSNNYNNNNNCKHIWDLAKKGNELTESLSNNEDVADNTIILLDSGEVKTNTVKITGDNSKFKGVIITTPEVKEVVFKKNSFVRTIDIKGNPLKYTFTGNNNVTDYNDYSVLNSKNEAKVNITSNNRATHLKNERKTLNINTDKINVSQNGILSFSYGNKFIIGKK